MKYHKNIIIAGLVALALTGCGKADSASAENWESLEKTDTEETETTVSEETEASAGSSIDAEALQKISLAERVLSWIREYRTVIAVSIFFLLFLLSALLLLFRTGKKGKYK